MVTDHTGSAYDRGSACVLKALARGQRRQAHPELVLRERHLATRITNGAAAAGSRGRKRRSSAPGLRAARCRSKELPHVRSLTNISHANERTAVLEYITKFSIAIDTT